MTVLISFFLKYLFAPLLVVLSLFILKALAKGKAVLQMKKLIVFMLVSALILILPSLLGMLKYEFIWSGLILTIICYLLLGTLYNWFFTTTLFESIGFEKKKWFIILALFITLILTSWLYYLVFNYLSKLSYSVWAMFLTFWFMIPIFFKFSLETFLKIPTKFYKLWIVQEESTNVEYWDNINTFKLMQVTVKIKRKPNDKNYSSFSVKLPEEVTIGQWFDRFIADQHIRFPNDNIELTNKGENFGWILYTAKWFPYPIFTRMLDFEQNISENKIKNKTTLFVRRVSNNNEIEK